MKKSSAALTALAGSALAAALFAPLAFGQAYPAKAIRLICPFPPAGAVDIASRATAHELQRLLGQPVTVENRPGAGGNVGGEAAAKAAPDGYTLFMNTSGIHAINPALYSKMPFDPAKDLIPVVPLVALNNVLVANPGFKVTSVKDLIAQAKAQPGKINYASSGSGTSIHMSGELFKYMTGVDILHIPYKGSGPAVTDLIGGQVNIMFDNIPSSLPHIKSGKLRGIATTGARRDPALPDLPTIAESGVPGYEAGVWFGLSVPAGTSREIVTRLNAEGVRATQAPEFVKRMRDLGYLIIPGTPEQMGEMLRAEVVRWAPVVKASGAKAD